METDFKTQEEMMKTEVKKLSDKEQYKYLLYMRKFKPDIWRDLQGNRKVKKLMKKFESINESGMELKKLEDAIKMFQKKIEKQGRVTNARDEDHLKKLIKIYKQMGGKKIKEAVNEHCHWKSSESYDVWSEETGIGYTLEFSTDKEAMHEAEYQGRKVKLNKPMQGDTGKFKVYVKNPKGNVVKVNFGAKGKKNRIKKSDPGRRASFRARHNCDSPGPRHKARYWSCKKW